MGRPATVFTLSEAEKSELLRRIKLRKTTLSCHLYAHGKDPVVKAHRVGLTFEICFSRQTLRSSDL